MCRSIVWLLVSAIGIVPVYAQDQARTEPLPVLAPVAVDKHFDLYENAANAYWQASGSGRLPFPGVEGDQRGYARTLAQAKLSTGEQAERLLESQPQGRGRGWIQAIYPPVTLGEGIQFRALAGFLAGTKDSDGARFSVRVREGRQRFRLLSHTLTADQSVHLQGDLSRWAGKTISVILRVDAGASATNDLAVWVNPRLEASR